jgi:Holliday junction resolvase
LSASRQKGTSWETAIVRYLQERGYPYAERRALSGSRDRGDISGLPGVVIEAKSCAQIRLSDWIDQAEEERHNAFSGEGIEGTVAVVWVKRRGKTSPADGYVVMTGEQFVELIR